MQKMTNGNAVVRFPTKISFTRVSRRPIITVAIKVAMLTVAVRHVMRGIVSFEDERRKGMTTFGSVSRTIVVRPQKEKTTAIPSHGSVIARPRLGLSRFSRTRVGLCLVSRGSEGASG